MAIMPLVTVLSQNENRLVAFPGAEGFGRFATGGRDLGNGSKVYVVNTLADNIKGEPIIEGSLRWALTDGDNTPRTIVFGVCGTIYLNDVLKFSHPNVTIAGQSAPGGGVCIAGAKMYVCTDNVIIRYVRFRAGDLEQNSYCSLDVENVNHCIIDHCSFSWSMEENVTMYDNDSTTMQWCILSDPLYNSKNVKGARAYAAQWGGEHSTFHHNLIANAYNRTPRINGVRDGGSTVGAHDQCVDEEIINNVVFNWGKSNSAYGGENSAPNIEKHYNRVYYIANYYKPGPYTIAKAESKRYFVQGDYLGDASTTGEWYLSGNVFEYVDQLSSKEVWKQENVDEVNLDNTLGVSVFDSKRAFNFKAGNLANSAEMAEKYLLKSQEVSSGIVAESAANAYVAVVANAGASLPRWDEHDTRILSEASGKVVSDFVSASRLNGIVDSQEDIKLDKCDELMLSEKEAHWPYLGLLKGEAVAEDSDGDGIYDDYEDQFGLDKNDSSDALLISSNGYSNVENFLNAIADGDYSFSQPDIESSIVRASAKENVLSIEYVDINGKTYSSPVRGLNVVKATYENGEVITWKIISE